MAAADLGPCFRTTPTRPSLSLHTGSASRRKPKLIVQQDTEADQYQIRRIGGNNSTSALSLGHWRAVEFVPSHLIDTQCPSSPDSIGLQEPSYGARTRPKRFSKFAAWVKRSGKDLVLRLRRQTNKSSVDFTDVHLSLPPELMGADISELIVPHKTHPQELESPYRLGVESLSKSRAELSSVRPHYELPDDHSLTSPTLTELPGSDVGELDAVEEGELLSPSGTIETNFSTAETIFNASETDDTPDMDILSFASQPLARGLTISKSIRYRCAAHQDFEPASPKDIIRLASRPSRTNVLMKHSVKRVKSSEQTMVEPIIAILESCQSEVAAPAQSPQHDLAPIEDNMLQRNGQVHITAIPAAHSAPMQAIYGIALSACVYQQDLHVAKALVQAQASSSHLVSVPTIASADVDGVQAMLEKLSSFGKPVGLYSTDKQDDKDYSENLAASRAQRRASGNRGSQVAARSLQKSLRAQPRPAADRARGENVGNLERPAQQGDPSMSDNHIISPLSPLSERDKQRRNSQGSLFVPVTPLTPEHTFKSESKYSRNPSAALKTQTIRDKDDSTLEQSDSSAEDAASCHFDSPERQHRVGDGTCSSQSSPGASNSREAGQIRESKTEEAMDACYPDDFGIRHLADIVDYQQSPAPVGEMPVPPVGFLFDDKIPALYKNTRFKLQIDTSVADRSQPQVVQPESSTASHAAEEVLQITGRAEPASGTAVRDTIAMLVSGLTTATVRSALWLQRHAGQEPPVPAGHVRVKWTCNCGSKLFDDFKELRPGAASRLEARLNKEAPHPYGGAPTGARGSQSSFSRTPASSGHPSSSATSWSNGSAGYGPPSGYPFKGTPRSSRTPSYQVFPTLPQLYLLTCIYEARNTPKVFNLPLHERPVRTDSHLADALQDRYRKVNAPWYRWLRLRGLTSIDLVQFYMHKNRFADVRMRDSLPEGPLAQAYEFDTPDTQPPVGGQYLLHLFKHPHEYDSEMIAYMSVPKKSDRLDYGIGWGIILTEGFLPERIWLLILFTLILFACVFGIVWSVKKGDLQGAFGVASFLTTVASVMIGFAQACLG